jgi:replicative DNA helicase
METAQRFREDRLRVGRISKELKNIAVDFNIPVVALAQVRRFAGGARAKMPTLEDLKDSGSIEQDADNVIFLHNPFDAEDDFVDPRDKAHFDTFAERGYTYQCLGVAKQRQGVTGVCCVLHDKGRMRYLTIDRTRATT